MVEVTLIEASRRAALQEMRRDERVWVLGEDVARGGLWGQYKDFLGEFGEQRVVSTPISESTIMGAGLGSALVGMRPIIEMRIFDFVMCAMDELDNQIAKIRYMFGGQARPALVVRMPHGMWRNSAAQHSQMLEAWFAHLPGVIVVTPSTAADHVTTVAASPSLTLRATPNGIGSIGSAISPFTQNRSFGSKNSTGSSLRMACTSRPAVSAGVAGVTTITPGRCANHASSICECCAAELRHMPCGIRTTTAGFACPPNM